MSAPSPEEPVTYLTAEQIAAYEKEARILRSRMIAHMLKVGSAFIFNKLASLRRKLAGPDASPAAIAEKARGDGPVHSSMGATHA